MEELVSVVVPVYNGETYLNRCIESLRGQTYPHLQIILVDDGSTDGSAEICQNWAERDDRILFVSQKNAGAGMARNTGLDHAQGRYLLFVDCDDFIHRHTVERCLAVAREQGVQAVLFGRTNVTADGRQQAVPVKTELMQFQKKEIIEDILPGLFTYERGMGISVWGKLLDMDLIRQHGVRFLSEREVLSEDACFILEVFARLSSLAILPENLYYYYKNEVSFSRRYKPDHQKLNDAFLQKGRELCQELGYPERVLWYLKARYHTYALVGMKQVVGSALPRKEKLQVMRAVFDNSLLRSTVCPETLALAIRPSKVFWRLFARRRFWLCYFLLWYKANR